MRTTSDFGHHSQNNNSSANPSSTNEAPQSREPRRRSPKHSGNATPNGRRSPNGGRRSPNSYHDRTTTVRFVNPSTSRLVCTKLNRVVPTMCKLDGTQQCLCANFLNGNCSNGSRCALAHVPRQYLWDFLSPVVDRASYLYVSGFKVRCYTPEMDTYYEIPSEYIFQTQGSEKYVELFNDNGDNFKEKFRLCPIMTNTGSCELGMDCMDIHCSIADLSSFPCIHTHVATAETVSRYERLPADVQVRVFYPNGEGDGDVYPGDDVLRTVGATQYEEAYMRNGTVPSMKMQHCAHFQNKKMCRLGDGCRFLHVVSLALSTPMQEDVASARVSPVGDMSTNESVQDTNAAPSLAGGRTQRKGNAATNALSMMLNGASSDAGVIVSANVERPPVTRPIPSENNTVPGGSDKAEENLNRRSPTRRNNPYGTSIA